MKAIKIGEKIFGILSNSEDVTEYVGKKIFPIVADASTSFPFIVYKREETIYEGTKDKKNYSPTVSIYIASETYKQSIDIADIVIDTLVDYEDEDIDFIKLVNSEEKFEENTFIQMLTFKIELV